MRAALKLALAIAALSIGLIGPAAAPATVGDIYVADEEAAPGATGAIFRVGALGGTATPIVSGAPFGDPSGMVMAPDGMLLVADYGGGPSGTGAIFRVDPRTRTVLLDGVAAGFHGMADLAFGPDGKLYVRGSIGPMNIGALFRVDPATGAATQLAAEQGDWDGDDGPIAVKRDGTIFFGDQDDELFKYDPKTLAVTEVLDNPLFDGLDGLAFTPDEKVLYVAAFAGSPNHVLRLDPVTGAFTSLGVQDAVAITLRTDRSLLYTDTSGPVAEKGLVPLSETLAPLGAFFSNGAPYSYPHDAVIEPQRCAGRVPTVVGTTGKDKLTGSRFADVFSALSGNDVIKSLGGKDFVCGGAGNDKLKGGGAKDRLIGGKGKKDTCNGGKGKDSTKGCEAGAP